MGKNLKVTALEQKYKAEMASALADMEVYLISTTGIGEHPDIVDAMSSIVDRYDDAKGKLESLGEMLNEMK